MTTSTQFYSLQIRDIRTYILAALFVVGNILLPQICHLVPNGGFIFLPIYFFTLVAAYKYGLAVGLITAIASPLANHILFGMPPESVLPVLLIKSTLLAILAAYAAKRFAKVNILLLLAVVLAYQIAGSLIESALAGSFAVGFQDLHIGLPGILLQVFGGYLIISRI